MIHWWVEWKTPIMFIVASILGLLVGFVSARVMFYLINRYLPLTKKNIYLRLFTIHWHYPFMSLMILGFLYLSQFIASNMLKIKLRYHHIMAILFICTITWLLIKTIYFVRDIVIAHQKKLNKTLDYNSRRINTQINILAKVFVVVIGIVGVALALMNIPRIHQLGVSILASAGILGIIVGLSAQKTLGNILAGIQLAFTQPLKIDDIIIVNDKSGVVEEITLTYVVLRAWDRRCFIIPITYFSENIFQNLTRNTTDRVGYIFFEVDYSVSVDKLRKELDAILATTDLWDGNVKSLSVTDAKTQTMEIRIALSASDFSLEWDLRCYVREKMLEFLQKHYPDSLPKLRLNVTK